MYFVREALGESLLKVARALFNIVHGMVRDLLSFSSNQVSNMMYRLKCGGLLA